MAKTNKFVKSISASHKEIKGRRATLLGSRVKAAQTRLIADLETEKDEFELQLENLTDLAPGSTTSLKVGGGKDFNPEQWVIDVQSIKVNLLENKVKLEVAKSTQDEWFADLDEEEEVAGN